LLEGGKMIPNIFVSSTIHDLLYLRESIRESILELSYNPILSEYGDIGYLPNVTAEKSCYISIQDCQLAVLIIGKRYGTISENGMSVTHNEFNYAKNRRIPIVTLVDKDVLTFKRVFDLNDQEVPKKGFPGMDHPEKTFSLIQQINNSEFNNGILPYTSASDAREHFKKQLAHLFGELIKSRYEYIAPEIKDILSEIKTLKHELLKEKGREPQAFLRATRFLLNRRSSKYYELIERTLGDVEAGVPILIKSASFKDFANQAGISIKIKEEIDLKKHIEGRNFVWASHGIMRDDTDPEKEDKMGTILVIDKKNVVMNDVANTYFETTHQMLIGEIQR